MRGQKSSIYACMLTAAALGGLYLYSASKRKKSNVVNDIQTRNTGTPDLPHPLMVCPALAGLPSLPRSVGSGHEPKNAPAYPAYPAFDPIPAGLPGLQSLTAIETPQLPPSASVAGFSFGRRTPTPASSKPDDDELPVSYNASATGPLGLQTISPLTTDEEEATTHKVKDVEDPCIQPKELWFSWATSYLGLKKADKVDVSSSEASATTATTTGITGITSGQSKVLRAAELKRRIQEGGWAKYLETRPQL